MTIFECNAVPFRRVVGGGASAAGHEFLVGFFLGGDGLADVMADSSMCRIIRNMYELLADDEGEDLLSNLTRKLQ